MSGLSATASRRCVRPPRAAPEPLEALAQREVGVVRRRVDLQQRLEGRARPLGLAGVVVRPAERLEDRALAGLQPIGALEDDRGLGVVAAVEQRLAALEQVVGALGLVGSGSVRRAARIPSAPMVARIARGLCSDAAEPGLALAVRREVDRLQPRRIGQPGDAPALGDRLARRSP